MTEREAPAQEPSPDRTVAALTFDAEHPSRVHHSAGALDSILDVLASHEIHATFFLQGRWVSSNPDLAKRIAGAGHAIGSHSTAHVAMTRLTDAGIEAEVGEARDRILEVTASDPRPLFRCPYGDGHNDERVAGVITSLGYRLIGWDVDPEDWNDDNSIEHVGSFVASSVADRQHRSPIVLLHTWPSTTPEALPHILEAGARSGVEWVTVPELANG